MVACTEELHIVADSFFLFSLTLCISSLCPVLFVLLQTPPSSPSLYVPAPFSPSQYHPCLKLVRYFGYTVCPPPFDAGNWNECTCHLHLRSSVLSRKKEAFACTKHIHKVQDRLEPVRKRGYEGRQELMQRKYLGTLHDPTLACCLFHALVKAAYSILGFI